MGEDPSKDLSSPFNENAAHVFHILTQIFWSFMCSHVHLCSSGPNL